MLAKLLDFRTPKRLTGVAVEARKLRETHVCEMPGVGDTFMSAECWTLETRSCLHGRSPEPRRPRRARQKTQRLHSKGKLAAEV